MAVYVGVASLVRRRRRSLAVVAPRQFTYRKEDKIAIAKNARLAWSEPPSVDLRDDSDGEEGRRRNNAPRSRSPNEDPECALPPGHPRESCRTTILARIVHFSYTPGGCVRPRAHQRVRSPAQYRSRGCVQRYTQSSVCTGLWTGSFHSSWQASVTRREVGGRQHFQAD